MQTEYVRARAAVEARAAQNTDAMTLERLAEGETALRTQALIALLHSPEFLAYADTWQKRFNYTMGHMELLGRLALFLFPGVSPSLVNQPSAAESGGFVM